MALLLGEYKLIGIYASDEDIIAWWQEKYGSPPAVIERTGGGTLVGPVDDTDQKGEAR